MNLLENARFVICFYINGVNKFFIIFMTCIQRLFVDFVSKRCIAKTKRFGDLFLKLLFCVGDWQFHLCDPDHEFSSFAA